MTPHDLETREDSARDLAQTEAANRADARAHWDGWQPETDTAETTATVIDCTGCPACAAIERDRERRAG